MKVFPALVLLILLTGFSFAAPVPPGDISFCLQIVNPGTYTLTTDLVDGLISLDNGENGCYWINTSNVILDCNGHSITSSSGNYVGVYTHQVLDNITVKNCDINGFAYGIDMQGTESGNITGLSILNNTLNSTDVDMVVYRVSGALVDGNMGDPTFDFLGMSNSVISNNFVNGSSSSGFNLRGDWSGYSRNNTIINNTVLGFGKDCFFIAYAIENYFINNTAAECGGSGFYVDEDSNDNKFIGNTARNNSLNNILKAGFDIYSVRNVLINNTAQNNSNGIYLSDGENNLSANHIFHNNIGLNLDSSSTSNIVAGNLIEENVYADMLVAGDPRMLYFDEQGCSNTIENNTGSGGRPILYSEEPVNLVGGEYAEIILCDADGSTLEGVTVDGSDVFDNNALALFFTDFTLIDNTQSNGNAMGIWLYGSELVLINNSQTNGNALAGLFITLSRNVFVNKHIGHDNDGEMPDFFDDENPFIAMIPPGAGVIEINYLPGMQPEMAAVERIIVPMEITYYNDSEFYDNGYGMAFLFTPNVTINNSEIHDNDLFGVLDASGSENGMQIINTNLYRNGQDILDFMQSSFGGGERAVEQSSFEFPEGVLWAEVVEASYLMSGIFGEPTPLPWNLDSARHGTGIPSVLLSLEDMSNAFYITTETQMPAMSQFEYYDGEYNRTVFLNFTNPTNLSSVHNKYFVILTMAEGKNAIDNFSVLWNQNEISGYDPETMGLYYLNITEIIRPKSVEPVNVTILADWVPVDDQILGTNRIDVETLRQPEAQFLRNFFPPLPGMTFYEGVYGLFAEALPDDGNDDQGGTERLSVSVESDCDGTTVTVTTGGKPLSGATVLVSDSQSLTSLAVGTTNSDGEFEFDECALTVKIYVNKNGYSPKSLMKSISCCPDETKPEEEPEPEPEPVDPQPEPKPEPEPEDQDDLPSCPGECGAEAYCDACSTGYTCVDYTCEKNDVSGEDGFVGDSKKVKVKIGNEPCPLCDIQVTAPDGKTFTGKTDENGEFSLPLSIEGLYKVALVDENGDVAAETTVKSLAKPAPSEDSKPTEEKTGEDYSWLFLVVLLVAVISFIIYSARMNKK